MKLTIFLFLFFVRMLYEERNKKKEKKEADCFAAMEKKKFENPEEKPEV